MYVKGGRNAVCLLSLPPFLYFYHIQQSVLYMAKLYLNCENSFYTKTRINNNFITYQIDMSSHKVIEYFRDIEHSTG